MRRPQGPATTPRLAGSNLAIRIWIAGEIPASSALYFIFLSRILYMVIIQKGIIKMNKYSSMGIKPIFIPIKPGPGKSQCPLKIANESHRIPITKKTKVTMILSFRE